MKTAKKGRSFCHRKHTGWTRASNALALTLSQADTEMVYRACSVFWTATYEVHESTESLVAAAEEKATRYVHTFSFEGKP